MIRIFNRILRTAKRNGFPLVLGLISGIYIGEYVYTPLPHIEFPQALQDARFRTFTDKVISLEGGWKLYPDGAYAGIDRRAHPDSPLWKMDLTQSQPSEQVRNEVYQTYMMGYFKRLRIADLPERIGFLLYDFGINAGNYTAAKAIQEIVFTNPRQIDGHMGLFTVGAILASGKDLPHEFSFARIAYYAHLAAQNPAKYGKDIDGWVSRTRKAFNFSQTLK